MGVYVQQISPTTLVSKQNYSRNCAVTVFVHGFSHFQFYYNCSQSEICLSNVNMGKG